MTFSVTIQKQLSLTDDPVTQPSPVRLVMLVIAFEELSDPGIFTYQIDTVTSDPFYSHVATAQDLQEYFFENPGGKDFVRLDNIDLTFDTAVQADDACTTIIARLDLLLTDLAALQNLGTPQIIVVTE